MSLLAPNTLVHRALLPLVACAALCLLVACSTTAEQQMARFKENKDRVQLLAAKRPDMKGDVHAKAAEFQQEYDGILAAGGDPKEALVALNSRMRKYIEVVDPSAAGPVGATGSKLNRPPMAPPPGGGAPMGGAPMGAGGGAGGKLGGPGGGMAPGGMAPGGVAPGGMAPGGMAPGGMAPGGGGLGGATAPGAVAPPQPVAAPMGGGKLGGAPGGAAPGAIPPPPSGPAPTTGKLGGTP